MIDRGGEAMARKRHTAEEIFAKRRQVDVLMSQGQLVAEAMRAIGVTEVTYYRFKLKSGLDILRS
jgi:putative transposase